MSLKNELKHYQLKHWFTTMSIGHIYEANFWLNVMGIAITNKIFEKLWTIGITDQKLSVTVIACLVSCSMFTK